MKILLLISIVLNGVLLMWVLFSFIPDDEQIASRADSIADSRLEECYRNGKCVKSYEYGRENCVTFTKK